MKDENLFLFVPEILISIRGVPPPYVKYKLGLLGSVVDLNPYSMGSLDPDSDPGGQK